MSDWIPLAERRPESAGTYLVGRAPIFVAQARYMPRLCGWKFPSAAMGFEPTHWMPMPEPPAENSSAK